MGRKQDDTPPINRGQRRAKSDIEKLIALEWNVIRKLWKLAQKAEYDKHRGVYYQNLASHARTLALLLRVAGVSEDQSGDLARLLQRIEKKAKKFVRVMNHE